MLLGNESETAIGVDSSREMLSVARHKLFRAGLRNCQVRQADMMTLPFDEDSFSVAVINMALHFADRPELAIKEAARVLSGGGRLVIVDFAPHNLTALREEQAHRWLGFDDGQVNDWFRKAGLIPGRARRLHGGELTVVLWTAELPANDAILSATERPRSGSTRRRSI